MSSIDNVCLICDDVRQEKGGKNTLVGVYNDVILFLKTDWEKSDSKLGLPQLVFANFVSNAPLGKTEISWWLEDPEGKLFATKKKRKEVIEISGRTQALILRFTPLGFDKLGDYRFCLKVGDFSYHKIFEIRVIDSLET